MAGFLPRQWHVGGHDGEALAPRVACKPCHLRKGDGWMRWIVGRRRACQAPCACVYYYISRIYMSTSAALCLGPVRLRAPPPCTACRAAPGGEPFAPGWWRVEEMVEGGGDGGGLELYMHGSHTRAGGCRLCMHRVAGCRAARLAHPRFAVWGCPTCSQTRLPHDRAAMVAQGELRGRSTSSMHRAAADTRGCGPGCMGLQPARVGVGGCGLTPCHSAIRSATLDLR